MVAILTYHHIKEPEAHQRGSSVSPAEFAQQMDFLKQQNFSVVTLDEIKQYLKGTRSLPPRSVAITFDDGYADVYTNAFPVLKANGFPATIFIIANRLKEPGEDFLTAAQIKEMLQANIHPGSHTVTHPRLTRLTIYEQVREIYDSKKIIEELLECQVNWFSYPYGNFDAQTVRLVREAGYSGAVSAIRDNMLKPQQLYYLPRIMVMPGISLRKFRYYFSPWYHLVHWWKNLRRWKIT